MKNYSKKFCYRCLSFVLAGSLFFSGSTFYAKRVSGASFSPERSLKKVISGKKGGKGSKVDLVSARALTGNVIRIRLDKSGFTVKKSDIEIKTKSQAAGLYNKNIKVRRLDFIDGKKYDIILKSSDDSSNYNSLSVGDYVHVKIKNLSGTQAKEFRYSNPVDPLISYETGIVGRKLSAAIDFSDWVTGYCKYKIIGLPSGFRVKKGENYIEITGKPKKTQVNKAVRVTAMDETGNKVTRKLYLIIGSEKKIVTMAEKQRNHVLCGDGKKEMLLYYTAGGSGQYQIRVKKGASLLSPANEIAHQGEEEYFMIDDTVSAGRYKIIYEAEDVNSSSKKARAAAVFQVEKPVKIKGKILAKDGTAIKDAYVLYTFLDKEHKYSSSYYEVESTKEDGSYMIYVAPSQLYEVYIESGEETYTDYKFIVARRNKHKRYKMNLYRVKLACADGDNLSGLDWYGEDDNTSLGTGSELLLPKGKYVISSDLTWMVYRASFTIQNDSMTVDVEKQSRVVGNLTVPGTTQNVAIAMQNEEGNVSAYQFTVPADGQYQFTADNVGTAALVVLLTESLPNQPVFGTSESDWIFEGKMSMSGYLKQGENYYLCMVSSDANIVTDVMVTQGGSTISSVSSLK